MREIVDAVTATSPAFSAISDPKFERDVRTAVTVALERFLDLAGTDEPALPPRSREVFASLGAAEAREERGPDALLAALRTASRLMLRKFSEALAELRPVSAAELIDLSDAVTAFVDELSAGSTEGYGRQLREQAGEGDRRRRQFAELLLRGGTAESVVGAAATTIGWPPPEEIVPVLLPLDQARDARFRYGSEGIVVERSRDAVLLLRSSPAPDALHGRGAVVGPPLSWDRTPEGVRLTELTAELVGTGAEPVFVEEHLATLALRGEPAALAVLAARRLAPLQHLRPTQRDRLLDTLHSWLLHWGARNEVAAELFVHPQTVSYRLKLLRELLGGTLDDPQRRFELLLVLSSR
ncbi:PucR C-terminal helix-turn-helix domain-containing protein [Cryptosporangium aurantiacum]|uniref:PucR C-terminal helix-turn-helix domain-containing protein n=1 Tax=Cryptosporangium aurantiacum TaxID=134849 RepID=A0A1M7QGD4_9ACTN|nr:PucR C-terminal helix-turn-helix domain-containing protein [Cryptosporangium aurantiacum]